MEHRLALAVLGFPRKTSNSPNLTIIHVRFLRRTWPSLYCFRLHRGRTKKKKFAKALSANSPRLLSWQLIGIDISGLAESVRIKY